MDGTEWTEAGRGSTRAEIIMRFYKGELGSYEDRRRAARVLLVGSTGDRMNLRLTGEPMTVADARRIARARG